MRGFGRKVQVMCKQEALLRRGHGLTPRQAPCLAHHFAEQVSGLKHLGEAARERALKSKVGGGRSMLGF
jgi:hypothetical protein